MKIYIIFCMIASFRLGRAFAFDNEPVLMFFKNEQPGNTVTVGQTLNTVEFTRLISQIKSSVDVIFVDGLRENDLRMLLKQQEMPTKNILYEPIVESPAAALSSFLASNPTIKSNIITDDIAIRALGDFMNKITSTSSDAVILTSSDKFSFKTRQPQYVNPSVYSCPNDTNDMTLIFGNGNENVSCAAMFYQIYLQDKSTTNKNNLTYLNIANFSLTCGSDLATLMLEFSPNNTVLNTTLTSLQLNFVKPNNSVYWYMDNSSFASTRDLGNLDVYYSGPTERMATLSHFSFACTRTYFQLFNKTDQVLYKVDLYISCFQIQPFNMDMKGTNFTFGQINYCQGFFTPGIWMSVSASFILIGILSFALSFLFGINTMDKFDDPKSKPLLIAQEK